MSTAPEDDETGARRDEPPVGEAVPTPLRPPAPAADEATETTEERGAADATQTDAGPRRPEPAPSTGTGVDEGPATPDDAPMNEPAMPSTPPARAETESTQEQSAEAPRPGVPTETSPAPREADGERPGPGEAAAQPTPTSATTSTSGTQSAPVRDQASPSAPRTPPPAIPAPSGDSGRRRFAIGAISALAVVVGLLVVQHLRHGWPFSLHHRVGVPSAGRVVSPSTGAPSAQQPAPRAHVELPRGQLSALGVRVVPVGRQTIGGALRTVVTIVPDESRLSHVHTRISGWIDRLIVRTTGERVRAGQPLAAIFSQELLASQTEYLAALRAAPNRDAPLVRGARERLQVFGMSPAQIAALERRGAPQRLVTVSAPRAGTVLRRSVTEGTAVDPSTELFTIADLSRVWALTEIPEVDAARVRVGSTATLSAPASGLPPFEADVSFVYPTLSERTRTLRARFEVANPDGQLRPGMYGTAQFETSTRDAIVVPRDAIVDTGIQQHVFVLEGESMLVPRIVQLGVQLDERVEVTDGLREGEQIVAAGVFLIDSESRLRASGGAGTGHAHGGGGASTDSSHEAPAPPRAAGHAGHGGAP